LSIAAVSKSVSKISHPVRTHVATLIQGLLVRVIDAATGELLHELVLDPHRDYRLTSQPSAPDGNTPNLTQVSEISVGDGQALIR